jgi:ribonuclease D
MEYLIKPQQIQGAIARYQKAKMLWLDTETADFNTKNPQLSLISILDDPTDLEGDQVCILDLLNYPDLLKEFTEKIMLNPEIEKIFHNAKYDCKFLGKTKVKNVTCTLEMARNIPYYLLPTSNFTLKTLTEKLSSFTNIDKTEQNSDWKQRPLTETQLNYAKMDVIYLAQIYTPLLQLMSLTNPTPQKEDITKLTLRYRQLEHRWKQLDSEVNHLKERLKKAMDSQSISEFQGFKLSEQNRTIKKTSFQNLAQLIQDYNLDLDFSINLTQSIQQQLGNNLNKLPIEEEISSFLQLKISLIDEEELPF